MAPQSSGNTWPQNSACVWHGWKQFCWNHNFRKQLEQSLSCFIILFNSIWLLDYLPKVKPLHWPINTWKHASSCLCKFLSETGALDYSLAIDQTSYIKLALWKLWKPKWSLGHAEQLLFSCLCSKVAVYSRKLQCFFGTASSSPSPASLDVIELVPS